MKDRVLKLFKRKLSPTASHEKWSEKWEDNEEFIQDRIDRFELLKNHLVQPPKKILEIGCGLAMESGMFQKEFGCELFLLDGDFSTNDKKTVRDADFGPASTMQFYLKTDYLKEKWEERGLDYNFIDANNVQFDDNLKFDFIYSGKSCGFHYPLATYRSVLEKHCSEDATLIFDLRNDVDQGDINFEIVKVLEDWDKAKTVEIKLL